MAQAWLKFKNFWGMKLPDLTVGISSPRCFAKYRLVPGFVGGGIPPKQKFLRIHPFGYAQGFLRRGMKNWIKENPKEFWILVGILLLGAVLRLYKIDQYMTFLGDEGRDVVLVRRLLVDFDPILVGPRTSIGDMYLGPLYYYLMAPALILANFSPVGPAVMIALLGVITIGFVWWVGREWFTTDSGQGRSLSIAGLVAASLYAVSPTVIIYSRSSWNPNIMPFFALLSIYAIWEIYRTGNWKWLIVLGVSCAFILQSHYLGLLLLPTIGIFWLLTYLKIRKLVPNVYSESASSAYSLVPDFVKYSLVGFAIFIFMMSPLVIFDARHGWRNFDAMRQFFSVRQETVSIKPWKALPKIWPQFVKVNTRLVAGRNEIVGGWYSVTLLLVLLGVLTTSLRSDVVKNKNAYLLLFSWLGFALLGLGLYKQEIYDHYYGFFFPAPFLLVGALAEMLVTRQRGLVGTIAYCLLPIALVILFVVNIRETPIRYQPNRQLQRTKETAYKIVQEARGQKFNLAVIAERNYEDAYQYFLEVWGAKVVDIDAQRPDTITDQLFAVCEIEEAKCDPTHNPKAEVANFGWSEVDNQWKVEGVAVYKLVHTQR